MVTNVHERLIQAPISRVGVLIDHLGSPDDQFWPNDRWPAIRFDRPLAVGAVGGHGPIRYFVEAYDPGRSITFHFTAPRGFHGTHGLKIEEVDGNSVNLRHELRMQTTGLARLSWPLVFRWLHDALVEDALDCAEASCETRLTVKREWSPYTRILRALVEWQMNRRRSFGPAAASLSRR